MKPLTETYNIKSRSDIIALCDELTIMIRKRLAANEHKNGPIFLIINGDGGIGKSIFWDRIRENLFKHGGIFIEQSSYSKQDVGQRLYETWQGNTQGHDQTFTMFCGNLRNGKFDYANALMNEETLPDLGDIVILSNVPEGYFSQHTPLFEIELTLDPIHLPIDDDFKANIEKARWSIKADVVSCTP